MGMKKNIIIISIGFFLTIVSVLFIDFNTYTITGDSVLIKTKLNEYKNQISNEAGVTITEGDFFKNFLPKLIDTSIKVFGSVMLIMIVISGIYLVLGGVDENFKEQAKKIFYYSIVGAVIITVSFAIVYGITQINWTG